MEHTAKDKIRNIEELVESYRRNMVMTGEWTEDESRLRMQIHLDDLQEKFPTKKVHAIARREEKKRIDEFHSLRNSKQIMQREYYFDEGLGESLNDHTAELKKKFPALTV